jgi:hypothetical protein
VLAGTSANDPALQAVQVVLLLADANQPGLHAMQSVAADVLLKEPAGQAGHESSAALV